MELSHHNERSDSALDSLEHELYNPRNKMDDITLHHVRDRKAYELPTSWGDNAPLITEGEKEKGFSFGTKFLIFSMLLLLGALGFSGWSMLSSRNIVSTANIDMNAEIIPYVEGGESVPVTFSLQNKNQSTLQNATLSLEYKQGIGSQDEQEKVHEKRDLGTINPNEFKQQNFNVVLYGSEAESRDLVFKLEYKVAGSAALFSKIITVSTVLKTPPVSVSIDGPKILSIDQHGTFVVTVKNNSATTSLPSTLSLILPNTFTVISSQPKSSTRGTTWVIPPLKSGESTKTTVIGSLNGTKGETTTMKAIIGSQGDTVSSIGVVYSSQVIDIKLRSSPLTLTAVLDTTGGVAETLGYGDKAIITLSYVNASDIPLQNVVLKMQLSGDAALYNQIDPTNGYYDSTTHSIIWDKTSIPELATLLPQVAGTLRIKVPIVLSGSNSPALKMILTGTASTQETDDVVASLQKTWVVQGSATLSAKTQYKNSPFANQGPIPPEPNKETTYTVHLVVSTQNAITNAKVVFRLPTYVKWRGTTSDNDKITYDDKTQTITWGLGDVEAEKTQVADIGLSVRPSQSHVGGSPPITSGLVFDADEVISRAHIRTTLSALTTYISGEAWGINPSKVVEK